MLPLDLDGICYDVSCSICSSKDFICWATLFVCELSQFVFRLRSYLCHGHLNRCLFGLWDNAELSGLCIRCQIMQFFLRAIVFVFFRLSAFTHTRGALAYRSELLRQRPPPIFQTISGLALRESEAWSMNAPQISRSVGWQAAYY